MSKFDCIDVGYRTEKSLNGMKPSVLKSGICKYFRRDKGEKFTWCVIEMALFGMKEKGDRLVTNLLNRLKILLMEDLSMYEMGRINRGIVLLDRWDLDRKNFQPIYEFCMMLEGSRRSRCVSYVKNFWNNFKITDKVELSKILKFKKTGDSLEMLRIGEGFIECIEKGDERVD